MNDDYYINGLKNKLIKYKIDEFKGSVGMIKKCFTVWKKEYGFFWLFNVVFTGFILLVELKRGVLVGTGEWMALLLLIFIVILMFHFFFIGLMQGDENDKRRSMENHTLSLAEFAKEYEIPEEVALQLLKEGKLDGFIAFKTYPLREKTKEEVQHLANQEPISEK